MALDFMERIHRLETHAPRRSTADKSGLSLLETSRESQSSLSIIIVSPF